MSFASTSTSTIVPPLNTSSLTQPIISATRNFDHFLRRLAKQFYISESDLIEFSNEYWGTELKQFSIEDSMLTSKINSKSSSVASTPRIGPTNSSSSASSCEIQAKLDQLSVSSTSAEKKRRLAPIGPKNNTCIYRMKSGARKDQLCGKACAGTFCTTHLPTNVITPTQTHEDRDDRYAPSASFLSSQTDQTQVKRKLQSKKPPSMLTNIDRFIESQTTTFKVVRKQLATSESILVNTDTNLVYDQAKDEIYGSYDETVGQIIPLSLEKIELCKALRLNYQLPPDLSIANEDESASSTRKNKRDLEMEQEDDDMYEELSGEEE
jgi:hypothetical protein